MRFTLSLSGRVSGNVFLMALVSSVISSCGVLVSAPEPTALPVPDVVPLISGSGNLVTAGGVVNSPAASAAESGEQLKSNLQSVSADKNIVKVFQTDRCNVLSRGGFIWFTNEVVLNDWLTPLDPAEAKAVRSKIDFSEQGALLLDYGIAGSKGSGASVVGDTLEIKGQDAIVRVKQFKAPANKRSVQVVTHPCSLFVMPRTGFTNLVVLSDLDDKLVSFENK